MRLPFVKMQGLGNDFVILDRLRHDATLDADALRRLADRRYGVGCDQVLELAPPTLPAAVADYRIYNADGSRAGHCGNGLRCIGAYLGEKHGLDGELVVNLDGREVRAVRTGSDQVRAEVGVPRFEPEAVPTTADANGCGYYAELNGEPVHFAALSVGNPHAVIRVDDVAAAPVAVLGPALQQSGFFPDGVNVGFLQIRDRSHVGLRVFERGVGETPACGSGACAAVASGIQDGALDRAVTVSLTGGELLVEWPDSDGAVWLTGPAHFVFEGTIEL